MGVSGHFTPKTFHPGTFHPNDISPLGNLNPRKFHPPEIPPQEHFNPFFEKRIQRVNWKKEPLLCKWCVNNRTKFDHRPWPKTHHSHFNCILVNNDKQKVSITWSTVSSMHAMNTTFTFNESLRIVSLNKSTQVTSSFTLQSFHMPITECDVLTKQKCRYVTYT